MKVSSGDFTLVSRLQPTPLQRAIDERGLDACADLVALAPPAELTRTLDADLWRVPAPGATEEFDAARFGEWLHVIAECGETVAARQIAAMDRDLLVAGLSAHVRVLHNVETTTFITTDEEELLNVRVPETALTADVAGYTVVATRTDAWDAVVFVLLALADEEPACFGEVMTACCEMSNEGFEVDGLDDLLSVRAQASFDAANAREERREEHGYVSAPEARAFLDAARRVALPIVVNSAAADTPPGLVPIGRGNRSSRYPMVEALMANLADRDIAAHAVRTSELAFLTNTLISGCSLLAGGLTAEQASEAAIATCNLGLETCPEPLETGSLAGRDLVATFRRGWTLVHREVSLHVAGQLVQALSSFEMADRETQAALTGLRRRLERDVAAGTPWRSSEALEVISILDPLVWLSLLGLLSECPVMPAAVRSLVRGLIEPVSPSAFDFIGSSNQITLIRDFARLLPSLLTR